ncbi:MAG: hypothetical protein AAGF95_31315 [Chloroflexota bacterium]
MRTNWLRYSTIIFLFTLVVSLNGGIVTATSQENVNDQVPKDIVIEPFSVIEQGLTDDDMRLNYEQLTEDLPSINEDSCRTYTRGINGKADVGFHIFTFGQRVGWCYDGTKVTFHEYEYIIEELLVWRYKGITSESHEANSDETFWRDNATAQFTGELVGVPVQSCFPSIYITVNGDGTYSGSEAMRPDICW